MGKKGLAFVLVCVAFLSTFNSCNDNTDYGYDPNTQTDTGGDTENKTVNSDYFKYTISDALAENCNTHEKSDDYSWDSTSVVQIILKENSATIIGTGAIANGSIITITAAGTYKISGSLSDGQILVNTENKDVVKLILAGVNITCASSAPIYIQKAAKVVVILADNTDNYLTDGTTYVLENTEENEPNAALFSTSDLTLFGNGTLTVDGNYNDGISSKDGLIIKNGTINVSAADDGIRGKDYLVIKNGNITVNSVGDGLKSDNEDDSTKGYIYIETGAINVASSGRDAITGQTDVLISNGNFNLTSGGGSSMTIDAGTSAKGIKAVVNTIVEKGDFIINSADDAIHSNGNAAINGGSIIISSGDDGIHADAVITINGGEINITKSYEGIEGPSITVNNGMVSIVASDDGFNASKGSGGESDDGSYLYIKGGSIYVNASNGDGLDSNGSIEITGGTIVVHGPQSQPEVGMDYNGTCVITGGFLIISGTNSNMTQGPSATSTQYSLKLITTLNNAAGTLFHIEDASGNDLVTFKPVHSYYSIVFSAPSLQNGSMYYIYTGGSSTGTEINGLYSGGKYTPGTQYTNFTVSSMVTSLGSSGPGGPPGR